MDAHSFALCVWCVAMSPFTLSVYGERLTPGSEVHQQMAMTNVTAGETLLQEGDKYHITIDFYIAL